MAADPDVPGRRPFEVTPKLALESAWSLAVRVCERELVPEGYALLGLRGVESLYAEALQAGYPFVAALVASSELFRSGDPKARLDPLPVESLFPERFLAAETSARAAISMDLERLLGEERDDSALAQVARAQGCYALAELLEERFSAELDGPAI